jgi:hypothetical protein
MRIEHRSAWRRYVPRSRSARLAVPVGIAIVVGLGLGVTVVSNGGSLNLAAGVGACPTASAAAAPSTSAAAAPSAAAAAAPAPSTAAGAATATPALATPTAAAATTAAAAAATTAAATPCPTASATATAAASPTTAAAAPAAVANVNCRIVVPANPLSAAGLATPYQLEGPPGMTPAASGCTTLNAANLGAFVQATILNPATGALAVYSPLVITQGTTPAAPPVVPTLPANAIVTIDFGFNGTNLTQVGATRFALRQGRCVNGLRGSVFGQVSFCNGTGFFQAVAQAEAAGLLVVPPAGVSPKTGLACTTTRSFTMIDQDQSDNVTTTYLLTAGGQTAQFNPTNAAALPNATQIINGSDNKLLAAFLDPTFGCTPFTAPDLSMGGTPGPSQALNEIQAAASQAAPIALVPENDEMVLVNGAFSATKTNLYRSNLGQPPISAANDATDSPMNYCQNMVNIQTPFLNANQALLATGGTPVAAVGNNLLTFLANRLQMSFVNLNCANFGLTNPVTVTLDGNGVAIAAKFNVTQQTATAAAATPVSTTAPVTVTPLPGHRMGRRDHLVQNPSGT